MSAPPAGEASRSGLRYRLEPGEVMGRFLAGLRAGQLWGRACDACARVLCPPAAVCLHCARPTARWVGVPDTGVVAAFAVVRVGADARRLPEPLIQAAIRLDGPEGAALMHRLAEVPRDPATPHGFALRAGDRVEAVWAPEEQRRGGILDLAHFRPAAPGSPPRPAPQGEPPPPLGAPVPADLDAPYVHPPGPAAALALAHLRDHGALLASRCPACQGPPRLPPQGFCSRCLGPTVTDVEVPLEGTVAGFAVVRHDADGEPLARPEVRALVRFDGVEGGLLHRLLVGAQEAQVGMRVRARLRPPSQRRGSVLDLDGFEPSA